MPENHMRNKYFSPRTNSTIFSHFIAENSLDKIIQDHMRSNYFPTGPSSTAFVDFTEERSI
jgi:hypothetical protein